MSKENRPEYKAAERLSQTTDKQLYISMKAFQIAAQETGSLIFVYDTKKQTVFADEQTAEKLGVSTVQTGVPYEIVRMGIVSADTKDEYIRIHEEVIGGAAEAGGIVKLIHADGESTVHELKFKAILSETGENTGISVGIYRNITERYLRESEMERYHQSIYSARRSTYRYDAGTDEMVIFAADSSAGEKENNVLYCYRNFMPRMRRGEFAKEADTKILQELFTNGSEDMIQLQLYNEKDKEPHWYGITGFKRPEQGNRGNGGTSFYGSIVDLTEYKKQELAYQKQEQILSVIRDEYIGIFEIDLKHDRYELLDFSHKEPPYICKEGCYSELTEKMVRNYVAEEHREAFLQVSDLKRLRELLLNERRVEVEFMTTNAGKTWQRGTFQALEYENGMPVKAVLCQTDIDSIKVEALKQHQAIYEAYQFAEAANAAKTEFLSHMSHDIRTPMNAIIGMTALAGAHIGDTDKVRECLTKINKASHHLLNLINEVLDMSKIESGTIEMQNEVFNLAELIDNMVTMVQPQIREKSHTLYVDVKNLKHENVIGDSMRIQQAFVNLISNAVKYTPDGGRIAISVKEKRASVSGYGEYEFRFEDNGIGMSEEFLEVIFDPFTRAEDSRLSKVSGTGLGMAITRNIIRMLDGDIQVVSKLGEGSCFIVTIRLKLQEDRETFEGANLSPLAGDEETVCEHSGLDLDEENFYENRIFEGKRILLAEDNELNAEIAIELMKMTGAEVDWAENGLKAVSMFEESEPGRYDILFMDIQMPVMDGYRASAAIRGLKREDAGQIPIVAMTANAFAEDVVQAVKAGMNAHISKPVSFAEIKAVMKNLWKESPDGILAGRRNNG